MWNLDRILGGSPAQQVSGSPSLGQRAGIKTIDENIKSLGFRPSIYSPDFSLLSKTEIKYLHDMNIRCIPWTVNEKKDMEELKSWKVDGFITDYPNRAKELGYTLRSQETK